MPSWSKKDERQYEHVKEGYEKRGKDGEEAEEIAARTVNKSRREHGHTPNEKTQGIGNPNTSLEDRSVDELHNRAKELHIEGESSMKKDELIKAIRKANG